MYKIRGKTMIMKRTKLQHSFLLSFLSFILLFLLCSIEEQSSQDWFKSPSP